AADRCCRAATTPWPDDACGAREARYVAAGRRYHGRPHAPSHRSPENAMISIVTLTLVSCSLLAASPQSPISRQPVRTVMPKAIANDLPIDAAQVRVVIKLVEQRADVAAEGRILAPDVLAVVGDRPIQPFFVGLESELKEIRRRQLAATPAGTLPLVDLSLYFEVATQSAIETRELVTRLNALDTVEIAYPRELPTPPPGDIPPVTPDFTSQQGYRGPAPTGIDGDAVMYTTGGMGAGIKVLDIEWGWDLDHEDLARLRPSSLVGPPIANSSYNNHGTAVGGIISADADIYGVTGFNPDVQFFVATDYPATGYSVANAIAVGLPTLGAGDVMVLEAQTTTPLGLGPTEWVQADFDAIVIATGLGVITVEAAGNGSVNLDSPTLGGLFNTAVRDSGAIIVGASNGSALARASFSCYGTRIDANGWGYNVVTTGYGTLFNPGDVRQHYASGFNGTSSATPIVTGAVLALRGAAIAQLDATAAAALDMFAIRTLLRTTGTPIASISNRPDCEALLAAAGITSGLSMRDEPRTGQTCHVDLLPAFPVTANDLWAFAASLTPGNQPMPAPYLGRYLLGTPTVPLGFGTFASTPATLAVTVPNSASYYGLRYYLQGFTLETAINRLTATNGVTLFVRR
ncbi:MAG: S8 family serine peptidase, partial [Planctomycetes bacterium]|nr:S8 family serine peptidase [Planctomycetota bacterium]